MSSINPFHTNMYVGKISYFVYIYQKDLRYRF